MKASKATLIKVIFALALSVNDIWASRPTINVVIQDTKVQSFDELDVSANYQFDVAEQVVAGGNYELRRSKYSPSSLYLNWDSKDFKSSVVFDTIDNEFYFNGNYKKERINVGVSFTSLLKDVVLKGTSSVSLKEGYKTTISPSYNVPVKKMNMVISQKIPKSKLNVNLAFTQLLKRPILSATCDLNKRQKFSPSIDIDSKKWNYVFEHNFDEGSSLTAKLSPKNTLSLIWRDEGKGGSWVSSADVQLETKDIAFSFKRNFML